MVRGKSWLVILEMNDNDYPFQLGRWDGPSQVVLVREVLTKQYWST